MSNKLQLQVILTALDKATAPLKRIQTGSIGAGRALKEARDNLKALNAQQRDVSALKAQRSAVMASEQQLAKAQQTLRTLREELKATQSPTAQFQQRFIKASQAVQQLTTKHQQQRSELQKVIGKLTQAGISTRDLGQTEDTLRGKMAATNQVIKQQETRLSRITAQQKRLAQAKASYEKSQGLAGSMAGSGAAGLASGYAIAKPLKSIIDAFAPNENAATQLKVSMMDQAGAVSADFQRISDLATGLGDRLPGTTADFQEMMTMLRRQGISAQSILGGTGEAAAYLGVQLNKPVAEAAEFAAKMQDATRTSEADMMGLMDTIQRAFYLGVDDNNMLQGFTKLSPVMSILKKEGLEATSALAPLLVMMDQTGMAGESAGNAIRKVFQAGVNQDKFDDANDLLKFYNAGFSLDFTDGKGEFGGIDNLFAQLKKFEKLNTVQRTSVTKAMFGDDAETLQVVNTLMSKGIAGYQEAAGKMQTQASLQTRVTEQLGTLTNVMEAAQGSWTNTQADIGSVVAPELKEFINRIGEVAVKVKDWVKANPQLTATLFKTAAGLALLLAIGGGLTLMLASVLGPMAMVRYGLGLLGIKGLSVFKPLWRLGKVALPAVVKGLRLLSIATLTNPILLLIAGIVIGAVLIYAYWDEIGAFFIGVWNEIKQGFSGGIGSIISTILDFTPLGLFYRAFAKVLDYLGIELPAKFSDFGKMMIGGIINGIKNKLGLLKGTVSEVADTTQEQYRKDMAIHSPSRVFAELGNHTMAGLNQGLAEGENDVMRQVAATAEAMAARPPVLPTPRPQPSAMESALGGVAGGIRSITDLGAGMLGLPSNAELNRPQAKGQVKPAQGLQGLLNGVAGQVRQITDAGAVSLGLPSNAQLSGPKAQGQGVPSTGLQGLLSSVAGQVRQITDAGAGMLGLPSQAQLKTQQQGNVPPGNLASNAGISFDRRAPIAPASSAPMVIQGDTITINLTTQAGSDAAAMRRLLNQLLDERERNKTARIRSRLSDND
jgi:TP901 family phage tail tape measure protein